MPNELKISLANLWRLSQKVVELLPSMWEALDSVPGQGVERNKRNRFLYPRIGVGADKKDWIILSAHFRPTILS